MTDQEARLRGIGEVVTSVSLALTGADDGQLDLVIDRALGSIARQEGAERAYVIRYANDGTFSNSHEWVADGQISHRDSIVGFAKSSFPYSVGLAEAGEVWHCADVATLPDGADAERRTFNAFGVRSVLQVPLRNGSECIGVVGFNHVSAPKEWPPLTIDLVQRIGDVIAFALMRRDIQRDLRAARDHAELAIQTKDRFLSELSHDLHTPLHAILGFAELLYASERPPNEQIALGHIITSARALQAQLDELLARAEGDGYSPRA